MIKTFTVHPPDGSPVVFNVYSLERSRKAAPSVRQRVLGIPYTCVGVVPRARSGVCPPGGRALPVMT